MTKTTDSQTTKSARKSRKTKVAEESQTQQETPQPASPEVAQEPTQEPASPKAPQPQAKAPMDITTQNVTKQLNALEAEAFRVVVRNPENGKMALYELSKEELIDKIKFFKQENYKGNDILIKPAGEHALAMVDGLSKESLQQMRERGLDPAVALQSSPDTFQAWIKLGQQPVPGQVRYEVGKMLAHDFNGDKDAAANGHYGRLAGFSNRSEPEHEGKLTWVRVESYRGEAIDPDVAAGLLDAAVGRVEEINENLSLSKAQMIQLVKDSANEPSVVSPAQEANNLVAYRQQAARLIGRYGEQGIDFARMDWMIAKDMTEKGWEKQDIANAIHDASPNRDPEKFNHMREYANRTAAKASFQVDMERKHQKQQENDKSKGMEI